MWFILWLVLGNLGWRWVSHTFENGVLVWYIASIITSIYCNYDCIRYRNDERMKAICLNFNEEKDRIIAVILLGGIVSVILCFIF